MNIVARLCLGLLLLVIGGKVFANTQTICSSSGVPSGWAISGYSVAPNCGPYGGPGEPYTNALQIVEFDNLPVGATLSGLCSIPGNASAYGWVQTSATTMGGGPCWDPSSINLTYVYGMNHVSCQNEAQNLCYPIPPVTGSITASPSNPVSVPYGQNATVTLSYTTGNLSGSACIWVSEDGAAETPMYCGGASGGTQAPWIVGGHTYLFHLYQQSGPISLATVPVNAISDGTPTLTLSPNPATIPAGQTSVSLNMSWNAPGYSQIDMYGTNSLVPNTIYCLGSASGSGSNTLGSISRGEVLRVYRGNRTFRVKSAVLRPEENQ